MASCHRVILCDSGQTMDCPLLYCINSYGTYRDRDIFHISRQNEVICSSESQQELRRTKALGLHWSLRYAPPSPVQPKLTIRADQNSTEGYRMNIGDRLRTLREAKNVTQGEVEKRTGLLRTYISRVENGHAVPSVETLEKFARALEVPMYQLLYDGEEPPKLTNLSKDKTAAAIMWGSKGKDARWLYKFRLLLARTEESDRKILMFTAQEMARRTAP